MVVSCVCYGERMNGCCGYCCVGADLGINRSARVCGFRPQGLIIAYMSFASDVIPFIAGD